MFAALLILSMIANGIGCVDAALPIGEKELLDPPKRWPAMEQVADSARRVLLTSFGYADSTGFVPENVEVYRIDQCSDTLDQEHTVVLHLYLVRGKDGDRDENVWLVTAEQNRIVARTLLAQLQTTCSTTFLRGCSQFNKGVISVLQLQHNFDCDAGEFVKTEKLPSIEIAVQTDGTITETFPDAPPEMPNSVNQGE